jgi:hypothetical protein
MRTNKTDREQLVKRLIKKFGYNEPIFAAEIVDTWKEYSRPRVFQILKELVKEDVITKDGPGVYYIASFIESLGKKRSIGRQQILDKMFIQDRGKMYGYYAGITLLNGLYLTRQMAFDIEVVSSKASAVVRKVKVQNSYVTVRKSRVPINKKNVYTLMLLEAFTRMKRPLYGKELLGIREFVKLRNIAEEDLIRYARYFPAHTMESILETGMENVFA